jgi:hypothetical protein
MVLLEPLAVTRLKVCTRSAGEKLMRIKDNPEVCIHGLE